MATIRPSLSLTTLFRSPARTALTFVLLGVVSFALIPEKAVIPYFCQMILREYRNVLSRPAFDFSQLEINKLLREFLMHGVEMDGAKSVIPFSHEDDRVFYDTALASGSILITGNIKHFPSEPFIMTLAEYMQKIDVI